jgi:hypothetical protein
MWFGSRGFTASELSCANPGLNPGVSSAQAEFGENGLGGEIRLDLICTPAAGAGSATVSASTTASASAALATLATHRSERLIGSRPLAAYPGAVSARAAATI